MHYGGTYSEDAVKRRNERCRLVVVFERVLPMHQRFPERALKGRHFIGNFSVLQTDEVDLFDAEKHLKLAQFQRAPDPGCPCQTATPRQAYLAPGSEGVQPLA